MTKVTHREKFGWAYGSRGPGGIHDVIVEVADGRPVPGAAGWWLSSLTTAQTVESELEMMRVLKLSKPPPHGIPSPAKPHLLNLSKHHQHLGSGMEGGHT